MALLSTIVYSTTDLSLDVARPRQRAVCLAATEEHHYVPRLQGQVAAVPRGKQGLRRLNVQPTSYII
jgi:hypothetical protein